MEMTKWAHRTKSSSELENETLLHDIGLIYAEHNGTYGYRRIADEYNATHEKQYNLKRFYRLVHNGIVRIDMVVKQAPQVEVQIKYMLVDYGAATELNATDSKLDGAKLKVFVDAGTTKIDTADLLPATSTLAICDAQHMPTIEGLVNGAVANGVATVYVYKE